MAENEELPVQEHELPGLGREIAHRLAAELGEWSRDKSDGGADGVFRPVWVLAGLRAAQEALAFQTARWALIARDRGASWSEIGEALGISKQAAQQKFGGKPE